MAECQHSLSNMNMILATEEQNARERYTHPTGNDACITNYNCVCVFNSLFCTVVCCRRLRCRPEQKKRHMMSCFVSMPAARCAQVKTSRRQSRNASFTISLTADSVYSLVLGGSCWVPYAVLRFTAQNFWPPRHIVVSTNIIAALVAAASAAAASAAAAPEMHPL